MNYLPDISGTPLVPSDPYTCGWVDEASDDGLECGAHADWHVTIGNDGSTRRAFLCTPHRDQRAEIILKGTRSDGTSLDAVIAEFGHTRKSLEDLPD